MIAESQFLQWIVGPKSGRSGVPKLQWTHFPESWGVFVLIALVLALAAGVFWLYRREIKTCPMRVKLLLGSLRLLTLLWLIALFLKPSVFYQQVNEIKPTIALLRDSSLSFDRGDRYRDPDQVRQLSVATGLPAEAIGRGDAKRSTLVNQVFGSTPEILAQMRLKGAIQVVDFSDGNTVAAMIPATGSEAANLTDQPPPASPMHPHDLDDSGNPTDGTTERTTEGTTGRAEEKDRAGFLNSPDDLLPRVEARGLGTDIWLALKETLDAPSRLSGIVLISDGQHNGSEDPIELAKKAAALGKPIFVVGVGDPHPPKNLSVNEVYVRNRAYPNEPFEIEAILQSSQVGESGMPPTVEVQLIQQKVNPGNGSHGPAEIVSTETVAVPDQGGRIRVDFEHVSHLPGRYVFSVAVDPLEDETETDDNHKAAPEMEVVDEKVKILLISGLPSWDYQQVQRLLQRDSSISLSCWLQSLDASRPQEGDAPISHLPRSMEELGKYNVVMLLDPNPEEFDRQWIELLQDFCKYKAGGVLFMAGPQFTSEFVTLSALRGVRELLPIRLGDNEFIDSYQALRAAKESKAGKMLLVNHNIDHPVMSFRSDPAETLDIWNQMPGIYWSFPTLAAKPTSRVLLERGDRVNSEGNQPLLVAGRYGAGSVLYMGFHGTWRWRPVGLQAQYFDRFWIQVVRYLVETRSLQGSRRGFIDLEKTEFELGERITLVGRVLTPQFQPATDPEFTAILRSGDGRSQKVLMKRLPQQNGRYEGTLVAQRIGTYQATIELGDPHSEQKLIAPVAFRIVPPSAESGAYWLNEKLLTEIATQSGGKYYPLEQINRLPGDLPTLVTLAEFNSPPEPLWDLTPLLRWIAFSLPVVLLSLEWAIRKWYKLL